MSDGRDPSLFALIAEWREWAMAWFLAMLGGGIRFAQKIAGADKEPWTRTQAVAKLALAGASGLMMFFLIQDLHFGAHWKALFIALAGHMGGEAIEFIEGIAKDAIRRAAGAAIPPPNDPPKG